MLKKGDLAPAFRLESDTGQTLGTEAFRGRRWVLYFYPKDNTSG